MAITVNWSTGVIDSDASILDLPAFHATLRDREDDDDGMLWPTTHRWKALDLGGGAFFYQLDLINGYTLRFPSAGNYQINGNLNATIVPVAGVYVERKTSAAYATTAIGGSGPSAESIASAVVAALNATTIPTNVKKVNDVVIKGTGVAPTFDGSGAMIDAGNPWLPA